MKHYVYFDYQSKVVLFECDAASLLEADALFTASTGKDPAKLNWICCTIQPLTLP